MRQISTTPIRIAIALGAVLAIGAASTARADDKHAKPARHHRHPRIVERATPPPAAFSGARLVTHPAWTFACEGAYGPNRGPACDIPIWVYGSPCEVGIGWGRSRPCSEP